MFVDEIHRDFGFEGPPFDPSALASVLGFKVKFGADGFSKDQDACITPGLISVNSNKPVARQRYSIAHEVIHTLFPDYQQELQRAGMFWRRDNDDSLVERLCQIGAAELVMPTFAFAPRLKELGFSLSSILSMREEYETSLEATARRVADVSDAHVIAMFLRPIVNGLLKKPVSTSDAVGEYSAYSPLRVSIACLSPACSEMRIEIGAEAPRTSVAFKAWKRASYRGFAGRRYEGSEIWPCLPGSDRCRCEAMALPEGSTSPQEVLCLLELDTPN